MSGRASQMGLLERCERCCHVSAASGASMEEHARERSGSMLGAGGVGAPSVQLSTSMEK